VEAQRLEVHATIASLERLEIAAVDLDRALTLAGSVVELKMVVVRSCDCQVQVVAVLDSWHGHLARNLHRLAELLALKVATSSYYYALLHYQGVVVEIAASICSAGLARRRWALCHMRLPMAYKS
jgi:hypothetical protein